MSKEAMKLALRSIRELVLDESDDAPALQGARMRKQKAEKALREALAEQPVQQELVAWEQFHEHMAGPNYVAPQRTWVGLTRMELIKCGVFPWGMSYKLYEAIEAKLKEKNNE